MVLNSNGDELMCFFESTPNAVEAGTAILGRLDAFNGSENELDSPFRLRIGIHTGASLLDRKRVFLLSEVVRAQQIACALIARVSRDQLLESSRCFMGSPFTPD